MEECDIVDKTTKIEIDEEQQRVYNVRKDIIGRVIGEG